MLRRPARQSRGDHGAPVPRPARLRPGCGRSVRRRVRAPRGRGAAEAPAPEGLHRGGAGRRRARPAREVGLRPLPGAADVADPGSSGDTIGFGARRIFDDDRIEAKYLNTPETPLYKKSQVLYGIDLARREIARASQAVVVEGYTDVMACHLAGVPTAVATCGTAFGDDHARVLRRLLLDHEEFRGEVIFTFDGDEAGQKAAIRAFDGDQNFVCQTYVAVEPERPRPVRPAAAAGGRRGARAGRAPGAALPLRARPTSCKYDLDRADGRVDAHARGRQAGVEHPRPVEGRRLRPGGGRDDRDRVDGGAARGPPRADRARSAPDQAQPAPGAPATQRRAELPDLRDPRLRSSARPSSWSSSSLAWSGGPRPRSDPTTSRTAPTAPCGTSSSRRPGAVAATRHWGARLRDAPDRRAAPVADQRARRGAARRRGSPTRRTSRCTSHRLQELTAKRRIAEVKSRLQRTNPVEQATEYNRMFGELVALEQHRRTPARAGPREPVRQSVIGRRGGVPADVLARVASARGEGARLGAAGSTAAGCSARARRLVSGSPQRPTLAVGAGRGRRAGTIDAARLRISEVGKYGEPRPSYTFADGGPRAAAPAGPRARHREHRAAAARPGPRTGSGSRVIGRRSPVGGRWPGCTPTTPASTPPTRTCAAVADAGARPGPGDEVGDRPLTRCPPSPI